MSGLLTNEALGVDSTSRVRWLGWRLVRRGHCAIKSTAVITSSLLSSLWAWQDTAVEMCSYAGVQWGSSLRWVCLDGWLDQIWCPKRPCLVNIALNTGSFEQLFTANVQNFKAYSATLYSPWITLRLSSRWLTSHISGTWLQTCRNIVINCSYAFIVSPGFSKIALANLTCEKAQRMVNFGYVKRSSIFCEYFSG